MAAASAWCDPTAQATAMRVPLRPRLWQPPRPPLSRPRRRSVLRSMRCRPLGAKEDPTTDKAKKAAAAWASQGRSPQTSLSAGRRFSPPGRQLPQVTSRRRTAIAPPSPHAALVGLQHGRWARPRRCTEVAMYMILKFEV